MSWRWAAASVVGTSHIFLGKRLQDAYSVSVVGDGSLLAIVADGAGSALFGHYGAWLICRYFKVALRSYADETGGTPDDEVIYKLMDNVRHRISLIAAARGANPRDFAATLTMAIVDKDQLMTVQVGDSSAVVLVDGQWEVVRWPDTGEYASTTYFVTDEPGPRLSIDRRFHTIDAIALFSDGVGDLALAQYDQTAYAGFFDPMFRPVAASLETGRIAGLSRKLADYLGSPLVCERTDDDKTLILAARI